MHAPRIAYLWMLLGAASFSVMSFLTSTLRGTYSWQTIAVVRSGLALVITVLLVRAAGAQLVLFRPGTLWIRSLAGSVALLANFYSMTHYPISEVLALSNMFPLWVAVLSWPVLGERPSGETWFATVLGVAGVFFLTREPVAVTAEQTASLLPVFTAVLASLASAVAMLGLHRLKGMDARAVVAHFSGVSLACCLVAFVFTAPLAPSAIESSATSVTKLAVLGIAATVGQLFLTKAFAAGPPAQVSVVGLTQIGFSMLLEVIFTGRQFTATTLIGLALVVTPTAWVLIRRSRSLPQHEEPVT